MDPAFGPIDAGEHVDHRALAGAVRSDQRMDVAALQAERDVLRRLDAADRPC